MSQLDFIPPKRPATQRFWEATRSRTLVLQRCLSCDSLVHHPREACPHCLSDVFEWEPSSGSGVVHAKSVHHRPFENRSAEDCPYVVAFVDLDDGVRFLANVVGDGHLQVRVGDRVRLTWTPAGNGYHLPAFELEPAESSHPTGEDEP